ncbi:MAG: flagellar hook-length control protein FliK [Xanthobacteraceae bacterium]
MQPVAAAVVLNAAVNMAPAPANAPAAGPAIGEPGKARARSTVPIDANQDASSAQDATDAAPARQARSAANTDSTANATSGSSDDSAKTQAPNASSPQQAQTRAANDATGPSQTDGIAPADTDHATARAAELFAISSSDTAAGTSSAQSGTGAAKADVDGLPNFGFSASAATPSTAAAAATSDTASTAAVPIAGLAVAIVARARAGSNQFEIRLDPPELGRIDVHLDVNRDGHVTSHVTADRADTLELLQNQQPQLERALEQAGLKTADNGLQFTLRDQSFTGQNNGSGSQPSTAQLVIPDPDLAPIDATQIYTRAGLGSGIDIRV